MGWGSKRKEPFTPQPAHKPPAVAMTVDVDVEAIDEMPESEPEVVEQSPLTAATIGATLRIQGELTGHEDITIDGNVEGRVEVLEHTLTIGPSASIKASIRARCIVIEGQVVGDATADDKVEITATGSLVGDIRAARVVLAENARFKGSIDMGWSESAPARAEVAERPALRRPVKEERPQKEERSPKEERSKEERPAPPPKAAAPATRTSALSALNWDEPPPPPLGTSAKDEES